MYQTNNLPAHNIMMFIAFLFILINMVAPGIGLCTLIPIGIIFICYSFKRIVNVIISATIGLILLLVFVYSASHLVPFFFLVTIIFALIHIKYILQNVRPILVGLYIYCVIFFLAIQELLLSSSTLYSSSYPASSMYVFYDDSIVLLFFKGLILASVLTYIFHLLMNWLYNNGYTLQTALPIMLIIPLGLLFPIIKWIDSSESKKVDFDPFEPVNISNPLKFSTDTIDSSDQSINFGSNNTKPYDPSDPDTIPKFLRDYKPTKYKNTLTNEPSFKENIINSTTDSSTVNELNLTDKELLSEKDNYIKSTEEKTKLAQDTTPLNLDLRSTNIMMLVTFLFVFINMIVEDSGMWTIIPVICLFIFYSFKRIVNVIVTAITATIIISIFPFLAPIAFILMIVIFILRLKYILLNWRPVLVGFYMYGIGIYFALISHSSHSHTILLNNTNTLFVLFSAIIVASIITFIFYLLMMWLFSYGYTMETALPIMGVTPLLIILLCLPFIKAFDTFDGAVDSSADTFEATDMTHQGGNFTHSAQGDVSAPGVHHTNSYVRTGPDGTPQFVRGYDATNPDGILENNLSYKSGTGTTTVTTSEGNAVITPNINGSHSAPNTNHVVADSGGQELKLQQKKPRSIEESV